MELDTKVRQYLTLLYGEQQASLVFEELVGRLERFRAGHPGLMKDAQPASLLTQQDVILITYGDQIQEPGKAPLQTLASFLEQTLQEEISGVHLLPFYPYSSDDGFSVIDYRQVDPPLGTWEDIAALGKNYRLMFDAVINHISQQSAWFQGFLQGEERYQNYFIVADPEQDLNKVVRPRALPLLTPFETAQGVRHVWTTFSDDQIDLNFANPQVFLEIIDVLLYYVERGADIIRLDAIAYLWKEVATNCIHLPQTHAVVKLFRSVLDVVAPHVLLITETNVPHEENISYFGSYDPHTHRTDEAQMVYQFPLAPLAVHALTAENARRLSDWANSLEVLPPFFNFIASHDGIGMMPARGLLEPGEIQSIIDRTLEHGGQVSYKNNPDGTRSVYELNITLYDLLNDPRHPDPDLDIARFLASQVIMLSLAGVPGIYFHSLTGSRNCLVCAEETGRARSINREKFDRAALEAELSDPQTLKARVFKGYRKLLSIRRVQPAFHPSGEQRVLDLGEAVFAVLRTAPDSIQQVMCLVNVTGSQQVLSPGELQRAGLPDLLKRTYAADLLSGERFDFNEGIRLDPFQAVWLTV